MHRPLGTGLLIWEVEMIMELKKLEQLLESFIRDFVSMKLSGKL